MVRNCHSNSFIAGVMVGGSVIKRLVVKELSCFVFAGDANPSPNSYTLPSMIGPRVPNRVSSACYSMPGRISLGSFDTDYAKTPGPARYATTVPDTYQKKSPTYSMLARNYMPGGKKGSNSFSMQKYCACSLLQKIPPKLLTVLGIH